MWSVNSVNGGMEIVYKISNNGNAGDWQKGLIVNGHGKPYENNMAFENRVFKGFFLLQKL